MNRAKSTKFIMDLERLNTMNEDGCLACGKKFSLGDTAVMACGAWEGGSKLIHENEAVFDKKKAIYVERNYFLAGR
jgi:hypothetical protein